MKKDIIIKVFIIIILVLIIRYVIDTIILNFVYSNSMNNSTVAVFKTDDIYGDVIVNNYRDGVKLKAHFTKLPGGKHGFHIHKAGDLRGEGCKNACDHYHVGSPQNHGGPPQRLSDKKQRHTGDLGNVTEGKYVFVLKDCLVMDLFGRSLIVHADEDDYGLGGKEDSLTTGHSGKRIACAVIGRSGAE